MPDVRSIQATDHDQAARKRLAEVCGEANTTSTDGVLSVAPADAKEVADVMRYAGEQGLSVSPRGGDTKAAWTGERRVDVLLQTRRMNSVTEHIWQDMTCTVGAGCTWSALQQTLARHGQFVALDPLWPEKATVGGIVAANDSGALRLAYGGLRDLVLGMTIVLADGTIAKSGGKVVKNVAGYDLQKLMCGAYGTLGVIAEVTFRLHALPKSVASFSFASSSAQALGMLLLRLLDSHFNTQSIQLCAGDKLFRLDVRLAALPQVIEAQRTALQLLTNKMGLTMSVADESVWQARQRIVEGQNARAPKSTILKATMLPGDIAAISQTIAGLGGRAVAQANGILYGSLNTAAASELQALRSTLQENGGSLTFLGALPANHTDRWEISSDTLRWMRELKRQFDPDAILNPGCFDEEG